jgi:TorA maturation chaperone TorD
MLEVRLRDDEQTSDLARECLYRFLAAALSDPWSGNWGPLFEEESRKLAHAAADLLRQEAPAGAALGFGELPREQLDLTALLHHLPDSASELRAEYNRTFGLVMCRECPPYETEYHPAEETFLRSQQLADIAGFYRAFGLAPSRSRPERPDHIALELEFMAFLLRKVHLAHEGASATHEQRTVCADALGKFFRDHLAWWLPAFTMGLRRKAGSGFYAEVGCVLAALLPLERGRLAAAAPRFPLHPALIEKPEEQSGCASCMTDH